MTDLPMVLRRTPMAFYVTAVIFFVWYLSNAYVELTSAPTAAEVLDGLSALTKSKALFEAAREGVYAAGTGVSLQILIAIYDRVGGK